MSLRVLLNDAYADAKSQASDLIRENALEPNDEQNDILYQDVFNALIDDTAYERIEAVELSDIAQQAILDAFNER